MYASKSRFDVGSVISFFSRFDPAKLLNLWLFGWLVCFFALFPAALAQTSTLTTMHSFETSGGGYTPHSGLIEGSDGYLYGTTASGGEDGFGTVYKIKKDGTGFVSLVSFDFYSNGSYLLAGVTEGSDGYLYGTSSNGGNSSGCGLGCGTLYRLKKDGTEFSTLVTFNGSTSGSIPTAGVIEASDGYLYGTTQYSMPFDEFYFYGTLYRVKKDGTEFKTLLYLYSRPQAGVIEGSDGYLYGTTYQGGAHNYGTVYKVQKDGTGFNPIVNFDSVSNGANPYAGVSESSDGYLYGTTVGPSFGTLYRVKKDGTSFTKLVTFDGVTQGANPYAGVTVGNGGWLYGTTYQGGLGGHGTTYQVKTDGTTFKMLYSFCVTGVPCNDGANPYGEILQTSSGLLYGTTSGNGGSTPFGGTIFKLCRSRGLRC